MFVNLLSQAMAALNCLMMFDNVWGMLWARELVLRSQPFEQDWITLEHAKPLQPAFQRPAPCLRSRTLSIHKATHTSQWHAVRTLALPGVR